MKVNKTQSQPPSIWTFTREDTHQEKMQCHITYAVKENSKSEQEEGEGALGKDFPEEVMPEYSLKG